MSKQPIRCEAERAYPMTAAQAWRLLADTDHLNRAVGLPAVEFSGLSGRLSRTARARAFGTIPVTWQEFPFDWIRERQYCVRREFERGPVERLTVGVELTPAPGTVTVRAYVEYVPSSVVGKWLRRQVTRMVGGMLDYCDRYLARRDAGVADPIPPVPARPKVNTALLGQRLSVLAQAPVRPGLIDQLHSHILHGSDDQLTGIRPFALAGQWGADREEVLRIFLHATKAGLFELRWELMCPACRVPKAEAGSLAEVPARFHCDACGIGYDADFDQRVELRFSVHPAIRAASMDTYCIGGPLRSPHIVAQQYLGAHEDRPVDLALAQPLQLRTVRSGGRLALHSAPAGARARDITLTYADGRWVGPHSLAAGDGLAIPDGDRLVLRNQTDGPILAAVEDPAWTAEASTAAQVTTLAEFRELFSSEVLAPGHQLAVSHLAFLFSDLRGSTQLYEAIGDAPAYSRVSRHFDFIDQAVRRGGGSIVKTMGDGVMCAFYRLDDALVTAVALQDQVAGWCREQGIEPALGLKVGVHHGPAIAMTANGRLDYFGRTVNLAARVAGQSRGGDVVLLREVLDQAGPAVLGGREDITVEHFTSKLRGLTDDQQLARLSPVPYPRPVASR